MPKRTRPGNTTQHAPPIVRGVQLVPQDDTRVTGWITPNGSSFYARVFESKNTANRWQCVVRCCGFAAQFGADTPTYAAQKADAAIMDLFHAFK